MDRGEGTGRAAAESHKSHAHARVSRKQALRAAGRRDRTSAARGSGAKRVARCRRGGGV